MLFFVVCCELYKQVSTQEAKKINKSSSLKTEDQPDVVQQIYAPLNALAQEQELPHQQVIGYPENQYVQLKQFYQWYLNSGLLESCQLINAGNPFVQSLCRNNSFKFETELIEYFSDLYGFQKGESWGFVTNSGSDGNNHGLYYGTKALMSKTGMSPVVYTQKDTHYSVKRLVDLQKLDFVQIPTDDDGKMSVKDLEKLIDPQRPVLIVIAVGTTATGAIDDQAEIDKVLQKVNPIAVYKHLDAALFGGYLPYLDADLINRQKCYFDSIAVSGHKFFGCDEPCGIFVTSNEVINQLNPFYVDYLNDKVPTLSCSRSGLSVLKLWWKIQSVGTKQYKVEAKQMIENAKYLLSRLLQIGVKAWCLDNSNTVFFQRPPQWIMDKWSLAPFVNKKYVENGKLAHIVVMQHVSQKIIDQFINDFHYSLK